MIKLDGCKLALLAAGVARVANSKAHRWKGDPDLDNIAARIDSIVSVYDIGPRDDKIRHVRFDFNNGHSVEVEVGPQPELITVDNRPDRDPPSGGSPIATSA